MASKSAKIKPGRTIVHIKVGADLQDFGVHKDLLCGWSAYFKAAFTSGFEESKTGIMKFPELDVDIFELFYNWLYTQQLLDMNTRSSEWPEAEDLLDLYIFADMARITTLKNQIIDAVNQSATLLSKYPRRCSVVYGTTQLQRTVCESL